VIPDFVQDDQAAKRGEGRFSSLAGVKDRHDRPHAEQLLDSPAAMVAALYGLPHALNSAM